MGRGQPAHEGDVNAVVVERSHGVLGVEFAQNDLNAGVFVAEFSEQLWEWLEERRRHCADPQPPELAAGCISRGRFGFVGQIDEQAALFKQHLAGRGQRHRARRAGQQLRPKSLFQCLDGLGQGWLRHVQTFRGSPKVQLLGDRDEVSSLAHFQH